MRWLVIISLVSACTVFDLPQCSSTPHYRVPLVNGPDRMIGDAYELVGVVEPEQTVQLIARRADDWFLTMNTQGKFTGWIYRNSGRLAGECERLPLIEASQVPALPALEACYFSPYGYASPHSVLNGPTPLDNQEVDIVDSGIFPVLAQSEERIQVIGENGVSGWLGQWGRMLGQCDQLPFVQTRPEVPGDGCYMYLYAPRDYGVSEQLSFDPAQQSTRTFPAEQYIEVLHFAGTTLSAVFAFQVRLPDATILWAYMGPYSTNVFEDGIHNCEAVPITYPDDLIPTETS